MKLIPGMQGNAAVWLYEDEAGTLVEPERLYVEDRRADLWGSWFADEHVGVDEGIDLYVRLRNGQALRLCLTVGVPAQPETPLRLVLKEGS